MKLLSTIESLNSPEEIFENKVKDIMENTLVNQGFFQSVNYLRDFKKETVM